MSTNFTYSLTLDDYINYEKIKFKQKKTGFLTYVSTLFFVAVGVFNMITTKEPTLLCISIIYLLVSVIIVLLDSRIMPSFKAKKYTSLDESYFMNRQIAINEDAVEISINQEDENGIQVTGVYPMQSFGAIFESNDYFLLFTALEHHIIPKKAIPEQELTFVENTLRARPNYLMIKC